MTELTLSTPSILFSAISLILLAYTNRFLSYAQVVRNLKADHDKNPSAITRLQLANLRRRLYMARQMQLFGVSSLLLCVVCTFLIYIGLQMAAVYTFGVALVLLVISLGISIRELLISVKALEIHLDTLERMKTLTATTGREGDIEPGRRRSATAARRPPAATAPTGGTAPAKKQPKSNLPGKAHRHPVRIVHAAAEIRKNRIRKNLLRIRHRDIQVPAGKARISPHRHLPNTLQYPLTPLMRLQTPKVLQPAAVHAADAAAAVGDAARPLPKQAQKPRKPPETTIRR